MTSAIQAIVPDLTSPTGLVTSTTANQLRALMDNPAAVTGAAPDPKPSTAGAGGSSSATSGMPNPYGLGITAYEPNTSPYIHQLADSKASVGSVSLKTMEDDYADADNTVNQNMKDASDAAIANQVNPAGDYAGGGIVEASGKTQAFIAAVMSAAAHNTPYVWGGTSLTSGVDCSGLIYAAAQAAGITDWKRYAAADYGKMPVTNAPRPGDIVYYAPGQAGVGPTGHVGIYIGNNQMVAAPQSGETVKVQQVFGTPTFHRIFNDTSFGTVLQPGGTYTYNYNGRTSPWTAQATTSVTGGVTRPFRNDSQQSAWLAAGGAEPSTVAYTPSTSSALKVAVPYASTFTSAGQKYGVPPALLAAVAKQESGFNPVIHSNAGAAGLMQFMPGTAASLGVNPLDPTSAINGAARLLAGLYRQFGSWELALAAYNAGPGAVQKYGGIPPYAETQGYVRNVTAIARTYGG